MHTHTDVISLRKCTRSPWFFFLRGTPDFFLFFFSERTQRLRDLLFKKDALEALTSAEFAMTLDTSIGNSALSAGGGEAELRAMTRIDYDRLLRRLSTTLSSIDNYYAGRSIMNSDELEQLRERIIDMQFQVTKLKLKLN